MSKYTFATASNRLQARSPSTIYACKLARLAASLLVTLAIAGNSSADEHGISADLISSAPDDARAYFISPQEGAQLNREFTVRFGLSGMGVAPAGVKMENTGHHHLLINIDLDELDLSQPLPANKHVIHFGKGQTEAKVKLEPGMHTLQLLLGNFAHIPHEKPVVSEQITVLVR